MEILENFEKAIKKRGSILACAAHASRGSNDVNDRSGVAMDDSE